MTTLAHISDIHLSPMPDIGWRDLLGKRITGYLNWKLKRHGELNSETLSSLVAHMQAQNAELNRLAWTDATHQTAKVPIDAAMKLLAAKGDKR